MSFAAAKAVSEANPFANAAREIGFVMPERYNASALLFDNLERGRGAHPAVIGPFGAWSYTELCAAASRYGHALLACGLNVVIACCSSSMTGRPIRRRSSAQSAPGWYPC